MSGGTCTHCTGTVAWFTFSAIMVFSFFTADSTSGAIQTIVKRKKSTGQVMATEDNKVMHNPVVHTHILRFISFLHWSYSTNLETLTT